MTKKEEPKKEEPSLVLSVIMTAFLLAMLWLWGTGIYSKGLKDGQTSPPPTPSLTDNQ